MSNTYIIQVRLDYLLHVVLFVPWALFFHARCKYFAQWIVLGLAFAFICEGVQYFLPYRAFNVNDLISNIIGVLTGFIIFTLLKLFPQKT